MRYCVFLLLLITGYSCTEKRSDLKDLFNADTLFQSNNALFRDLSSETFRKQKEQVDSIITELEQIDRNDLSLEERINYDVFYLIQLERKGRLDNGMYQIPFDAEVGFHNDINYYLNGLRLRTSEDLSHYVEKLQAFPNYIEANMNLMKTGMESGVVSNKLIAGKYKEQIRPFTAKDEEQNSFLKVLNSASGKIDQDTFNLYRDTISSLVHDIIIPAYDKYSVFMETQYLPFISDEVGISAVTNGKAFYENRVRYYTTLDMTAEEVFSIGQQEVKRIRKEMEDIIKELDFKGSYSDFLKFLREDEQFYAKSPRHILELASYYSKKIDGKLPEYFGKLPRLTYGVSPVPEAIAPHYTSGRYSPGSIKNHKAGQYWVNTHNLKSRPLYALPALTLHEAVPGHHLHFALTEELGELPGFRNTYISAFGEGWALYCEHLGNEMRIYETPYEQFGRLTYEMWRACRLVVDPGLHIKGWDRQKALDFLMSNTALSSHECNTEIDRYIGWPGQAVSYKIGELKIKELRKTAEEKLGSRFDIREFHDLVLSNGSIPLSTLEELVLAYIDKQQKEEKS